MKQVKKMIVLAVLAVVMTMMSGTDAKAGQVNTTEPIVWEKGYTISQGFDDYSCYTMNLTSSGKVSFTLQLTKNNCGKICIINPGDDSTVASDWLKAGTNTYSYNLLAGEYIVKIKQLVTASMVSSFVPSGETSIENYLNKNNQLGTASYAIGGKAKAQFAENDDTDIYKVKISKSGYLMVRFANEISSMNMTITCPNADINYKENNIPLGSSSYKYFVPKGTYYLTFSENGYEGTYTFSTTLSGLTTSKVRAAKNVNGKKAKITWAKKSDVDGYQVQVATNKKFTQNRKSKEISGQNTSNYTFTKLKKGKTYYARVRIYKLVNGKKCYSDWSAAKAVKIRK